MVGVDEEGISLWFTDHEGSEFCNMDGLDEKLVNNFGEIFFSKYPRQLTVFR